jgi:hypothetical protein
MLNAMRDLSSMHHRIADLRGHATAFRKLAEGSHAPQRAQFLDLAERCDEIAANIELNLPIHEG